MIKYPKEVFVQQVSDEPGYLLACQEMNDLEMDPGDTITVGVYRLVETVKIVETREVRRKKGSMASSK